MKIEKIESIESEVQRFMSRLLDLKAEVINQKDQKYQYVEGTYKSGAVKRAALDLKVALTRITQNRD
ncbi:hypothetical protein [Dyadobacter bucti]|uniref:hypothetical protein n=1 Tax=Dyadobacter bucti TaxID=2572203 RepID=UPI001109CAD9|nr:hypothetical protein [Dyadobacter bucti]